MGNPAKSEQWVAVYETIARRKTAVSPNDILQALPETPAGTMSAILSILARKGLLKRHGQRGAYSYTAQQRLSKEKVLDAHASYREEQRLRHKAVKERDLAAHEELTLKVGELTRLQDEVRDLSRRLAYLEQELGVTGEPDPLMELYGPIGEATHGS